MHKIKSHASDEYISKSGIGARHYAGNEVADYWAGKAAAQNEVPWGDMARNQWIDAICTLVLKRVVAIFTRIIPEAKNDRPDVDMDTQDNARPHRLDAEIANLEHVAVDDDGKTCLNCGQSWGRSKRSMVIRAGPCPGVLAWQIPNHLRGQWVPARGMGLIYHGVRGSRPHTTLLGIVESFTAGHAEPTPYPGWTTYPFHAG